MATAPPAAPSDVQDQFAAALAHHQAGRLNEAKQLYWHILTAAPDHADSLHLLGVIAHQVRKHDLAAGLIRRAIAINPAAAPYHANLAQVLRERGEFAGAIASARQAIALAPGFAEAHHSLATLLEQQGQPDEALACYRRAVELRPDDPAAHNSLGSALQRLGRHDEAIASHRRALALKPDLAEAHNDLGNALQLQDWLDEALAAYHQAIALRPTYAEAYNNLGNALRRLGRLDDAAACCRHALALKPDYAAAQANLALAERAQAELAAGGHDLHTPEAHNNRGNALQQQGRLDAAVAAYRRALALEPGMAEIHSNLGNALQMQGRLEEAVACYERALALRPDYPEALVNLGNARREQGRVADAVACCRRALALRPDYPQAHGNLAQALLALGDMAAGWPEFEWRWDMPQLIGSRRSFPQPQWRGEPAPERTLLIHAEQGFGDTIQFCRYATLAAARGLRVVLLVQPPLVRLLRSLSGVEAVLPYGADLPPFDLHCPMLSLPLALGTTLQTVPAAVPYLAADAAQVGAWQARLTAPSDRRPRVGLAWAGNPRADLPALAPVDRRRSLAPERLAPLLAVPGVHFISLQKDGPPPPAGAMTEFMHAMADFADTAALVATLDLIISVDTAVVHLAGALGRPVWMLDRFDPCWRWLTGRRDSPWYPTLRLYRQPRPGDWDDVLAEAARDLRTLASTSGSAPRPPPPSR